MTLQFSLDVAHARLNAVESTIGTSPYLLLYGGTVPADCAAVADLNNLLAMFPLPSDWLTAAQNNVAGATSAWNGSALKMGTATFFRVVDSGFTTCHMQGSVSALNTNVGDLRLSDTLIVPGASFQMSAFFLREPGVRPFQGTMSLSLDALTDSATGAITNTSVTSTRFNQTPYTNQWVYRNATMPTSNGVLVSLWAKMPVPVTSHPTTLGNTEVLRVNFSNWFMRCIGFNFNTTSGSTGDFNANSMLFLDGTAVSEGAESYVGDATFLLDIGVPWTYENGWVFFAWHFAADASGNLTLNQWVRYAGQTLQGPYTTNYSISSIRTDVQANSGWTSAHANAFTPTQTVSEIQINGGNGSDAYIIHARVEDVATAPSNTHINDISNLTSADTTAWADWSLEWNGSADLTDRSGNSRGLTGMGGSLSAGGTFP
jgi:hypothetical protein